MTALQLPPEVKSTTALNLTYRKLNRQLNRQLVQWLVVLGVWYCLLVDCLGNWAGQNHGASWVPIIWGVVAVLIFLHGLMIGSLMGRES